MSEHTPGPWHTELVTKTDTQLQATLVVGADDSIWPSFGRTIAEVGHWRDRPNSEADAHLIAAAPCLLQCLEEVEVWVDADGNKHWCSGIGATVNIKRMECLAKCLPTRAAIAEAKGVQP